mgnify:CR=1 FL=1
MDELWWKATFLTCLQLKAAVKVSLSICCSVAVDHFDITNMCVQITQDILTVVYQWVSKVQGNYDRCWQPELLSRGSCLLLKKGRTTWNVKNKILTSSIHWTKAWLFLAEVLLNPALAYILGYYYLYCFKSLGSLSAPSHHFFQSFLSQVLQNICPCKSATLHPRTDFIPRN